MLLARGCFVLSFALPLLFKATNAFAPPRQEIARFHRRHTVPLFSSSNDRFDLSKPVFDVYTWRGVRGDALAKYNSLNQSEPLRINLSLLAAFLAASYPGLADEIGATTSLVVPTPVCALAAVACLANFGRECQRRNRQLTRLEKELQALALTIRLPNNAFADAPYEAAVQSIRTVQSQRTLRVVAVLGSASQLTRALQDLSVLAPRLVQAETIVVPVPTDGSALGDWVGADKDPSVWRSKGPWLAAPGNVNEWKQYFEALATGEGDESADDGQFKWFGLSAVGRSFGSGKGDYPSWLQLLGQHMRPTALLDSEDDPLENATAKGHQEAEILPQLQEFYRALTEGDEPAMAQIFGGASSAAQQVTDVMNEGGRLDPWSLCLQDGNRPAGMKVAGADVLMINATTAYSSVIEFPAVAYGSAMDQTLLAVQTWTKNDETSKWTLVQHQTIPWSDVAPAAGTLVCDGRGCVSLVRRR